MTTPPLSRTLGPAERALRALLDRELARERLSFPEWTALVFTRSSPLTSDEIARRQLAGYVVADASEAHEAVAALIRAGLLARDTDARLSQTEQGRRVFADISEAVEKVTEARWGGPPRGRPRGDAPDTGRGDRTGPVAAGLTAVTPRLPLTQHSRPPPQPRCAERQKEEPDAELAIAT